MSNKLLYSASGRIQKIVLFDTKYYTLPPDENVASRLAEVRKTHIDLINGMHVLNNEIWFYVFYNKTRSSVGSGYYEDCSIKTRFIAISDFLSNLYVPTRWTQNVLLVGPGQTLVYDNNHISHTFAELIRQHTGLARTVPQYRDKTGLIGAVHTKDTYDEEPADRICGGELLIGRVDDNGDNYVLHGLNTNRLPQIKKDMGTLFKIDLERFFKNIQSLDNEFTREYKKAFYHIDYFCMILGWLPDKKMESVLVAKPSVFIPRKMPDRNGRNITPAGSQAMALTEPLKPYPISYDDKLDNPRNFAFWYIELPHYIFLKEKKGFASPENISLVLSYTNCLVENFRLKKREHCTHFKKEQPEEKYRCEQCKSERIINVYFPDYREQMAGYVAESFNNPDVAASLQDFLDKTLPDEDIPVEKWTKPEDARQSMNRFFDRVHLYIRNKLARHGIYNVQFVRHNFFNLAKSGGSLHCLAKVVERDMVY